MFSDEKIVVSNIELQIIIIIYFFRVQFIFLNIFATDIMNVFFLNIF